MTETEHKSHVVGSMGSSDNVVHAMKSVDATKVVVVGSQAEEERNKVKERILASAILGAWGVPVSHIAKTLGGSRKPKQKCGLPGCINLGEKDYCCAEHCRQHREMRKGKR